MSKINAALRRYAQLELRRINTTTPTGSAHPVDYDANAVAIIERVRPFTMTSPEKLFGLIQGVRYLARNGIAGDIVECGVWRGGSSMAAALTLIEAGDVGRDLFLFDTFKGMPPPSDLDKRFDGRPAEGFLTGERNTEDHVWAFAPESEVREAMLSTGYPAERMHFVVGKVEDTIPGVSPSQIAVLRLDTDWYESTRHELDHLYPRLVAGGVLILDDYGHWDGAKQAVDEWIDREQPQIFLSRLDEGRIGIAPWPRQST